MVKNNKPVTQEKKNKKSKVQNNLDEELLTEAVKSLLAYEAKKSTQENEHSLIDNYAKPILLQVGFPEALDLFDTSLISP